MKIALGILSNDLESARDKINKYGIHFDNVYLNYAIEEPLEEIQVDDFIDVNLVQVPVNMDFANARNAVMRVLEEDYIVWLDDDEYFNMSLLALIENGGLVKMLEENAVDVIGVPRENLIDNVPSAVWPDVQFRIMKKEIRWTKPVHEHPEFEGNKVAVLPNEFHLIHPKSSERFSEQQKLYNKITPGAGQSEAN